uniref:Uncharacterized protein n=1 Tax=Anguilla anguilla TaxID=7936 RepID=A0A0E9PRR6_ANGAN
MKIQMAALVQCERCYWQFFNEYIIIHVS